MFNILKILNILNSRRRVSIKDIYIISLNRVYTLLYLIFTFFFIFIFLILIYLYLNLFLNLF